MGATPSDGGPLGISSEVAHGSRKHTDLRKLAIGKAPGDITLAPAYAKGMMNVRPIGTRMGWVWMQRNGSMARHAIRSAGIVRMGLATYVLGLAVGSRALFLGRGARLWRVPGVQLSGPAVSLAAVPQEEARLLADTAARVLAEAMTPRPELELTDEANLRYRAIARALVMQRVVEAAAQGVPREPKDYAAGVSPEWDAHDLMSPRYPDMQHAILLSLVLALSAKDAAGLIELGALLEHRVPIVTKEAAGMMYQQACALLARLCPEWWSRAHLTEWTQVGSIEALFRGQYCRMLNSAWAKDGRAEVERVDGNATMAERGEAYMDDADGE
jgi:hypothetical protein